jgi:hypothetical protein
VGPEVNKDLVNKVHYIQHRGGRGHQDIQRLLGTARRAQWDPTILGKRRVMGWTPEFTHV